MFGNITSFFFTYRQSAWYIKSFFIQFPSLGFSIRWFSPSTYQSGKQNNAYAHIEKRGSRYLRYALYNATKYVCYWNPTFAAYLTKKRSEGKHYNVAIFHAVKTGENHISFRKTKQQYRITKIQKSQIKYLFDGSYKDVKCQVKLTHFFV